MAERESLLLHQHLDTIRDACASAPALDLACGMGRNGRFLLSVGIPVVFADLRPDALQEVATRLEQDTASGERGTASYWEIDLETGDPDPFAGRQYGAILVFRYLHRPLLPAIREAVQPGGLVIYETFTIDQPTYGRPTNPDFLLQRGELESTFAGWEILESWEGTRMRTASAHIVARRPAK